MFIHGGMRCHSSIIQRFEISIYLKYSLQLQTICRTWLGGVLSSVNRVNDTIYLTLFGVLHHSFEPLDSFVVECYRNYRVFLISLSSLSYLYFYAVILIIRLYTHYTSLFMSNRLYKQTSLLIMKKTYPSVQKTTNFFREIKRVYIIWYNLLIVPNCF